jgi:hypothetical protein
MGLRRLSADSAQNHYKSITLALLTRFDTECKSSELLETK